MSFQLRSKRHGSRRTNASRRPATPRRGAFEMLEARLALTADLGFAGAFDIIGGSTGGIYTSSGPNQGRGGGMVTDLAGNGYVSVNGAFHSSSFDPYEASETIDLDPGLGVSATTMTAGLVKLDPNGAVAWKAAFSAIGGPVRVNAAVDANQNVYLVGDFRGTVDFDPGSGVTNITSSANGTDYSFYMLKLNSAGQLQWVRTLAANELSPVRVAIDGAGNLIVASNFTAVPSDPPMDVDAGPGQFLMQAKGDDYDLVVLKYSTDGNFVWASQIGNTGSSQFGNVPALGVNAQGDVFVSGAYKGSIDLNPGAGIYTVTNNDTTFDRYLVHLDPAGNFVWGYTTEGPAQVSIRDIAFQDDGSLILGGFFTGTTDFQPGAGNVSLTSLGTSSNGLVVKLNSDSSVAWARQFGGQGENVTEVDLDEAGNIYLGGSIVYPGQAGSTSDFDPGPGVYQLITPSTKETAYVLSLTGAGDFRWAVPLGGNTGRSQVEGLSVTPIGDVQVSGAFRGTGDFNPDPALETWLASTGVNQTVFTATLTQSEPDPGAPTVDAGVGQTILITGSASLHGTVADDGLPNPVSTTWSLHSGPGTVAFGNAAALDTTAAFSKIGSYVLKLEATDGQFTTADYVHIIVNPLTAALTATADAYIDNGNATTNYGASASLLVDGKPDDAALLKWNLSSIPAGSTLQSATFTINVTNASVNTYEIYELKRTWTESQATWKKANSGTNWQSAGAQGSLDRGSTVLGTVTASATGVRTVTLNAAGLAVVQGWINNPATNNGFVIQDYANTNTDDLAFSSKEASTAANRPQLSVVYTPPSAAPLALLGGGSSQAALLVATTSSGAGATGRAARTALLSEEAAGASASSPAASNSSAATSDSAVGAKPQKKSASEPKDRDTAAVDLAFAGLDVQSL